jgi:hypothetical protein
MRPWCASAQDKISATTRAPSFVGQCHLEAVSLVGQLVVVQAVVIPTLAVRGDLYETHAGRSFQSRWTFNCHFQVEAM